MKKYLKFIASLLVGSAVAWFVVVNYGWSMSTVYGPSMEPTFHDLDKIMVSHWPLLFRKPHVGEVVVVWDVKSNEYVIKRVAAVPGMPIVQLSTGKPYKLSKNQYIVLGDNSANSYDSRYYGPVHLVQIVGVVKQ